MRFGILGTGMVGQTLARKLVEQGHEVRMGSRSADNDKAAEFATEAGQGASHGTFADAAAFGTIVFNCTAGAHSLDALHAAGAQNLSGKVLIDVCNPLDFSKGFPPSLSVVNTDSQAERIQRAFPAARVVKALNTVNAAVMVAPERLPGTHALFTCGNDPEAKQIVEEILRGFGWEQIIDLGDLSSARGTEAYLLLWVQMYQVLATPDFNIAVVRG